MPLHTYYIPLTSTKIEDLLAALSEAFDEIETTPYVRVDTTQERLVLLLESLAEPVVQSSLDGEDSTEAQGSGKAEETPEYTLESGETYDRVGMKVALREGRIPEGTAVQHRDGHRYIVAIGQGFRFTLKPVNPTRQRPGPHRTRIAAAIGAE